MTQPTSKRLVTEESLTSGSAADLLSATFVTLGTPTKHAPGLGLYFPEAEGAVGDGVADDTAAIQLAINAANAAGRGVVALYGGTYKTSAPLNAKTNVTIDGQHKATIRRANGGADTLTIQSNAQSDMIIRNLTLDGNGVNQSAGTYVINIFQGSDVTLECVSVTGVKHSAFHTQGVTGVTFDKCRVDAFADPGWGLYIQGCTDVLVKGCNLDANTGGAGAWTITAAVINTENCNGVTIDGNWVLNCSGFGIALAAGCRDAIVSNNRVLGNLGNAIDTAAAWPCTVTGNVIDGGVDGIDADFSSATTPLDIGASLTITGNSISNVTRWGITAITGHAGSKVHGVAITGNAINECDADGIYIVNLDGATVTGNSIINPGATGTLFAGLAYGNCDNSVIAHNTVVDTRATKVAYAARVTTANTGSNNLVTGNNFFGCKHSYVKGGAANATPDAVDCYRGNLGMNPAGPVTAPAIPASATALQNPFPYDCMVWVNGGTVNNVFVWNADNTAFVTTLQTGGMFLVPWGAKITLSYSVAPTWVWYAN